MPQDFQNDQHLILQDLSNKMKVKKETLLEDFFFFLKKSTIYFPRTSIKNSLEKVRMLKGRAKIRIELSCYQTSFALGCERVPHRKEIQEGDTSILIKQFSK